MVIQFIHTCVFSNMLEVGVSLKNNNSYDMTDINIDLLLGHVSNGYLCSYAIKKGFNVILKALVNIELIFGALYFVNKA